MRTNLIYYIGGDLVSFAIVRNDFFTRFIGWQLAFQFGIGKFIFSFNISNTNGKV